jgi:hypothetical protein
METLNDLIERKKWVLCIFDLLYVVVVVVVVVVIYPYISRCHRDPLFIQPICYTSDIVTSKRPLPVAFHQQSKNERK